MFPSGYSTSSSYSSGSRAFGSSASHSPAGSLSSASIARRLDAHRLRLGPQRAHDDAVLGLVGAENAVGVGAEIDGHRASAAWCMSRSIPATGIPTQSGRLSSS